MFGIKAMELIFIGGVLLVFASVVGGVIYIAVRLAIRHQQKNSN